MVPRVTPLLVNTRVKVPAGRPSSSKVPFAEMVVVIEGFSWTVTVTWPDGAAIAWKPPAEEVLAGLWLKVAPCRVTPALVPDGEVGLLLQPETARVKNAITAERRTWLRVMHTSDWCKGRQLSSMARFTTRRTLYFAFGRSPCSGVIGITSAAPWAPLPV